MNRRTDEKAIRECLEDIVLYAQDAHDYVRTFGDGFEFVAHLNSITEELDNIKVLISQHENIRLRDDGVLDFKPLQGWDDD